VAINRSGAVERLLRALLESGTLGGLTDAELLEWFVARDGTTAEAAFAVLVERHGPLVLSVCRGFLRDEHAAEDAFQATFVVLVKKAASLRVHVSLGPWLHAVAYRVACEARSDAARRAKHERRFAEMAARVEGIEDRPREGWEFHLHEEIQKLAERHRQAIVLCDLEGLTHEEAARLLGTPVGTIKSRLARGRELLRNRLTRRGVGPGGGMLLPALAAGAPQAEIVRALVDRTARTAMLAANRGPTIAGTVPASVAILVRKVLRSMFHSRLKMAGAAITASAGFAISVGFGAHGLLARAEPTVQADVPRRDGDRGAKVSLVGHSGLIRSAAFAAGGRELISAAAPSDDHQQPGEIRLWDVRTARSLRTINLDGDPFAMAAASDGRTLALAVARGDTADRSSILRVLDLPSGQTKHEWALPKGVDVWSLAFAPDGKALAAGVGGLKDARFYGEVRIWDLSSGKERPPLTGHANPVMSVSYARNGSLLASGSGAYGAPVGEVGLWDAASGRLLRTLTEADIAVVTVAFSPDGKMVAGGGTMWRDGKVFGGVVSVWDVATGTKQKTLPAFPSYIHEVSYAPTAALLATGGVGPNGEGQVLLWDTATWKALRALTPGRIVQPVTAVKCLVFSPDGKSLAAGGAAGTLTVWRIDPRD
jgi:RNA polymerase sigma factor (sigma-70 family)